MLEAEVLKELKKGVGFEDDVPILRTSIDRPELVIRTGCIPTKSRQNASALRFLFDEGGRANPESASSPQEIQKTIAFFNSRRHMLPAGV